MSHAIVDTHRLFSDLKQRGFTDQQAEGVAEAIADIDLSHLVTKADLQAELRQLEIRMIKWMIPLLLGQTAVFALIVKWLVG